MSVNRKRTILMYGRTRAGKTSLIGEFAEHLMSTLGKKTLVYTIDKGGIGPLTPYIELGLVDVVSQDDSDPWIFMNNLGKGKVRDSKGKWTQADLEQYAMVANESLTGFSDAFMNSLAEKSAQNMNIGGAANVSFVVQDKDESLKIGGSNMGHYNIVQTRILTEFWNSQKLNVPYILWTASATRDEDPNATGKVIGPAVAGKALTSEIPRHCDLTFRVDCLPAQNGKPERHILYLGNSIDQAAGNAVSLGNTRVPMGGKELPATIEPASLVTAIKLIAETEATAKVAIEKRIKEAKQVSKSA